MAFDFPNSPTEGQTFTPSGGPTYVYHAPAWELNTTSASIPAAPFDAMSYNGMQINGGFEVSQQKGTTPTSVTDYICDGWILYVAGTGVISVSASSPGAPNFGGILGANITTAQATMGAGDYYTITQYIEGYRISRLGWGGTSAQPITIGFWTAHKKTGVYGGSVCNAAATRCCAFTYTQNVSWTWQYNVVTLPGCTDGAWAINNTVGMALSFAFACGSTLIAPSTGTWLTSNYVSGPGQVNGITSTSDQILMTGVTVLPGSQAPTAAQSPNIMRPYDQELILCQRYFQWVPFSMAFSAYAVGESMQAAVTYSPMRTNPTMSAISADPNSTGAYLNNYSNDFVANTPYSAMARLSATAVGLCYVVGYRASADARM